MGSLVGTKLQTRYSSKLLSNMNLWLLSPLFLLLPAPAQLTMVAISQELPPPPPNCCLKKVLPNTGNYTFQEMSDELEENYGCMDNCVYTKDGTEEKYCFATGPHQVICEEIHCGPVECGLTCTNGEECVKNEGILCVQPPCCAAWECVKPDVGYFTIKEDGTIFKQQFENTPDFLKMTVEAHNNYTDAVVFYDKKTGLRVSCTQGRDTAAPFDWDDSKDIMEYVRENEGRVIDAATEKKIYFMELVTSEEIPDDERPVDIAPDRPIYRSELREISSEEFNQVEQSGRAMDQPTCIRIPETHHVV